MKRITLILSFIIFSTQIAYLQANQQQKAAAKITFEKTTHDFGKIKKGKTATVDFNYKNDGNDMLFISRINKACGCTEPEFSQEPIAPGQSGKIKIGYNTTTQAVGTFSKTVTVFSNAENSAVVLTFKGEIIE